MAAEARTTARADQLRAALSGALDEPCTCGECPTDEQVRALLALDDDDLVRAISKARADGG